MNDIVNTRLRRARYKRTQKEKAKPKDNGAFWAKVYIYSWITIISSTLYFVFSIVFSLWGLVL